MESTEERPRYVKTRCAHCGKGFYKTKSEFNRTESKNKNHFCGRSCSCAFKNRKVPKDDSGKLPWWGIELYKSAEKRARRSGIEFSLSESDMIDVVNVAKGKCHVSGICFDLYSPIPEKGMRRPYFPSIDRIDNSKGYHRDNVRLVCQIVNYAMNEFGESLFHKIALAVVVHNKLHIKFPGSLGGKGSRGVNRSPNGKYRARYNNIHIGIFPTEEEAIKAYNEARAESRLKKYESSVKYK